MAEVRRETLAGGGETFDGIEGTLCERQPAGEVGIGGQGGGEPVPQPSDLLLAGEIQVVESDARAGRRGTLLGRATVDKFGLGD